MPVLLAGICGLLFGALDQYLGSRITLGAWTASVSGLSAPWLVLPFAVGISHAQARRAMVGGLVAVLAALAGYFVLTVSPLEGVPTARFLPSLVAMARENAPWVVGGVVTAPLYGLLGQRWRLRRAWTSAVAVAGCVCLEPVARWAAGRPSATATVTLAEVAAGLLLAAVFSAGVWQRRRALP